MAVSASLLLASITLRPRLSFPNSTSLTGSGLHRTLSIPPLTLAVSAPRPKSKSKSKVSVSSSLPPPLLTQGLAPPNPSLPPLTGSTRTIPTLLANALPPPPKSLFFSAIPLLPPAPPLFSPPNPTSIFLRNLSKPATVSFPLLPPNCKLAASYSPDPPPIPARNYTHSQLTGSTALFFAVISPQIFSCALLIRVLLGWFPNIQWDNPLMSAIRDLCDSYLSLFRGIIPPLFNSLDVSPILAFLLLGMLGQLARPPRPY